MSGKKENDTEKPKVRSLEKEARLKAALKANMARRKAQTRGRNAAEVEGKKGE